MRFCAIILISFFALNAAGIQSASALKKAPSSVMVKNELKNLVKENTGSSVIKKERISSPAYLSIPPMIIEAILYILLGGLFIGLLVPPLKKSVSFALVAVLSMILNWGIGHWVESGWSIVIATVLAAAAGIPLAGGKE